MLRLSLIGPGDIDFHFYQLLKFKKERFESELEKIAKALVDANVSLELLPDRGISFELARLYKQFGGKEVIGAVPESDKTFGIKHLQKYIEAKIERKKVFDRIMNSGDWFKHDLIKGLFGDAVLYLGSSPGTEGELHYATYLYKLFQRMKTDVDVVREKVHPEIKAGKNYTYLVYTSFLINKKFLSETEAYLTKIRINLIYIKNTYELKKKLLHLQNLNLKTLCLA